MIRYTFLTILNRAKYTKSTTVPREIETLVRGHHSTVVRILVPDPASPGSNHGSGVFFRKNFQCCCDNWQHTANTVECESLCTALQHLSLVATRRYPVEHQFLDSGCNTIVTALGSWVHIRAGAFSSLSYCQNFLRCPESGTSRWHIYLPMIFL